MANLQNTLVNTSVEIIDIELISKWKPVFFFFTIQSPRGYSYSNNILRLHASPQASKLCVWCTAQGERIITSVKQTTEEETRLSALEGVVNDESWHGDTVWGGCLSLSCSHTKHTFLRELHHWRYDLLHDCLIRFHWTMCHMKDKRKVVMESKKWRYATVWSQDFSP